MLEQMIFFHCQHEWEGITTTRLHRHLVSMPDIDAVLDSKYLRQDVPTTPALVVKVADRTKLRAMLPILSKHAPLSSCGMNHMKRIDSRTSECRVFIACIRDQQSLTKEEAIEQLDEPLQKFLATFSLEDICIELVPTSAPLTRAQFGWASKLWSVSFYEDKHIAKCLNGTMFNPEQCSVFTNRMQQILAMIQNDPRKMAALIARNDCSQVVVCAQSRTHTDPLGHACIVAIDTIAQLHQGNSMSHELKFDDRDYLCTGYDCFLSQEPCIACAMALVHSRIKRVFVYRDDHSVCGECDDHAYTVHRLHTLKGLNHHYQVFIVTPGKEQLDEDNSRASH